MKGWVFQGPRHSVVCLVFLILSAMSCSVAASTSWVPIGPFGGAIKVIRFSRTQPGVVYAGASSGVYISRNGGLSWSMLGPSLGQPLFSSPNNILTQVMDIAEDPLRPGDVYAVSGPFLYRYDAGSGTWSNVYNVSSWPYGISAIAMDPFDPERILLSANGLFESTNGGRSFHQLYLYGVGPSISFSESRPNLVLESAPHGDGYAISVNGGKSWKTQPNSESGGGGALAGGDPNRVYAYVEVNVSSLSWPDQTDIYRSDDDGSTWQQVAAITNPLAPFLGTPPPDSADRLVADPHDPDTLYLTFRYAAVIYKSTDGGMTWNALAQPAENFSSLAVDPFDSSHLLVISGQGGNLGSPDLLSSWDGGATFAVTDLGLASQDATGVAVDPSDPSVFYAETIYGFYRSTDGGARWEDQGSAYGSIALTVDPLGDHYLYACFNDEDGDVFQYDIPQDNWVDTKFGAPTIVRPSGIAGNVLLASGWDPNSETGFVFGSSDSGTTWQVIMSSYSGGEFVIAPSSITPQKVYLLDDDAVSVSTDGGGTWTAQGTVPNVASFQDQLTPFVVSPQSDNVLFIVGGAGMARSTDAGVTWHTTYTCPVGDDCINQMIYADPVDAGVVYTGNAPGLLESDDDGATWNLTSVPGLEGHVTLSMTHPTWAPAVSLVGTSDASVFIKSDPADLAVSIAGGSGSVALGSPVAYSVAVKDQGTVDAKSVTVVLTVPSNVSFTVDDAGGAVCTAESGSVTVCRLAQVAAGAEWDMHISATLNTGTGGNLRAEVGTGQGDADFSNNAAAANFSTQAAADLAVRISAAHGTVTTGQHGKAFTVTAVNNSSTDTAATVMVFYSPLATVTAPPGASCAPVTSGFVCTLADLPAGGSSVLDFTGTFPRIGTVSASAFIAPVGVVNTDAADSSASAQIAVQKASTTGSGGSTSGSGSGGTGGTTGGSGAPATGGGGGFGLLFLPLLLAFRQAMSRSVIREMEVT